MQVRTLPGSSREPQPWSFFWPRAARVGGCTTRSCKHTHIRVRGLDAVKLCRALQRLCRGISGTPLLAGGNHSLAFPQEGGLLVFGYNFFGQLGLNHTTHLLTPTLCPVQPDLPHSFTSRSTKKSARSFEAVCHD